MNANMYSCITHTPVQVHFQRSVKRVAERANKAHSKDGYKAYTSIAYCIPQRDKAEDVITLFEVLGGQRPLEDAISLLPDNKVLQNYYQDTINQTGGYAVPGVNGGQNKST